MEIHHYYSCILILLLNWGVAATPTTLPPPSSALLAADTLRYRGYTLFASSLLSLTTTTSNFSGTILAPPDFSFSFAAAKFLNNHRPPPRPTTALLLYHTLKPPHILNWSQLSSLAENQELQTHYSNDCLFVNKNFGNELSISSTPFKNQISAVKIRQPDIYVDENLTVHGIDSVLDPTLATKCSDFVSPTVNRTFLDHAIRALRRTGYSTVAAAMGVRRFELLSLTSVTIFAVSDYDFFEKADGFRYDFRRHVVPMRRRFLDLARTVGGTELETLAPNKTVVVESVDGDVYVDGVAVGRTEVYRNRWIVVVSVAVSLDDVVRSKADSSVSDGSAPFPANLTEVPSPSPSPDDFLNVNSMSLAPENSGTSPAPAPVSDGVGDGRCDVNGVVSVGVEGGDLFCPVEKRRELREDEIWTGVYVDVSQPSDTEKVQIVEKVNIADDLFFYF